MQSVIGLVCLRTGCVFLKDGTSVPPTVSASGVEHFWVPAMEAEPHFTRFVTSESLATDRTPDGRFDMSHLSPERAYRIGRDYLAHCIRYGWPMKVVKENFGPGARIMEMGCGEELPFFRTLTCDHSAVTHYKPARYVGADLNRVKYHPQVTGISSTILSECNIVTQPERIPNEVFDLVVSFEVLEHMDKPAQEQFIDTAVSIARRKAEREGKSGLILLSTPVNSGKMAKNHIAEPYLAEMERFWTRRNVTVKSRFGTFANLRDLTQVLTAFERHVWNDLARYHAPDTLVAFFAANHPEVARNVAWLCEVGVDALTLE